MIVTTQVTAMTTPTATLTPDPGEEGGGAVVVVVLSASWLVVELEFTEVVILLLSAGNKFAVLRAT